MKITRAAATFLYFFVLASRSEAIDSFDTSLSKDFKTSKRQELPISSTPSLPSAATPSIPSISRSGPLQAPAVSTLKTTNALPKTPDLPSSSYGSQMNVPQMNRLRISVPDYEEQFRKLFEAKEAERKVKKKKLAEKILDEFVRYGFHIGFALVIIILFYALRKDKQAPGTGLRLPGQISPKKKKPDGKIWHDDF